MSEQPTPDAAHSSSCTVCGATLTANLTGRRAVYCSQACRQRAYRSRRENSRLDRSDGRGKLGPARIDASGPVHRGTELQGSERAVPYLTERELLAWRGLIEIEARLLPIFDDALRRTLGMTINEFDVLYHLWIAPNQRCRMTELSRSVVVTPSGVTRIVTRLEERQLVLRAGRKGRQAVDAALTPLGERTLRHAMEIHFANVRMRFIDRLRSVDVDWLIELRRRFY